MNAAQIDLSSLQKSFGKTDVIPELSARIEAGSFTVILGPSGCGKSTLLNMIAGLEEVSGGKIMIDGREVQDLPAKDRGLAMVFQNYALYPHMSVADNIGYSLRVARVPKPERRKRIEEAAKVVSLSDYLERRPGQLSGGQRQRVAIARAIVREPRVLLFDEPLSNLDAKLRHGMRMELAELHKRIGATSVFVTHDQVEAMTLADKIMVLNEGQIQQYGTPQEIYHKPATTFVAEFIGAPPMNLISVEGRNGRLHLPDGVGCGPSRPTGSFAARDPARTCYNGRRWSVGGGDLPRRPGQPQRDPGAAGGRARASDCDTARPGLRGKRPIDCAIPGPCTQLVRPR